MATQPTVQYDSKTGVKLNPGQTTTFGGLTVAQGQNLPSNIIPAVNLGTAGSTPYTIPNNQTTISDAAINGSVASNTTASTALEKSQQDIVDTSKSDLTTYLGQLAGVNTDIGNVNSSVDRAAQNAARLQADQYTNQIEAEQRSNQKAIEELQKNNPNGLFGGGLEQKINDLNRASLSKQADLAILQNAANRNYTSMAAVADEMVKNNLSQLQAKSENLKLFIDQNQSNFTTAEKNLFDIAHEKVQAELAKKTAVETAIANIKLEAAKNGAGADILTALSKIDTTAPDAYDQALKAAGKYGGDYLKQDLLKAQIANEYASLAKTKADIISNAPVSKAIESSVISADAEDVLAGRNTLYNIRQTMGRSDKAAKYMLDLRNQIRSKDSAFDFVASDAGGKYVSSTYFQRAMSAIDSVLPNVDKIVELSDQVSRIGVKGVDSLLQKTKAQFGNKEVSNFRQAQKLIADEIGVALGAGTVSDMKLQLGFDVTNPNVTAEVFASNMGVVKEFILNRKAGLNQQRYSSPTSNTQYGGASVTPTQAPINAFSAALGVTPPVPGSSILAPSSNGSFNFIIPTK